MARVKKYVRFRRWLRRIGLYTGKLTRVNYIASQTEAPDTPLPNQIIIIGTPNHQKWLFLDCPCGHGHSIMLSLMQGAKPHWYIDINQKGIPTITPSIDREKNSEGRCHFWLRNGKIFWV